MRFKRVQTVCLPVVANVSILYDNLTANFDMYGY